MTQSRIQDYGSPVVAQTLKTMNKSFVTSAILSGNQFLVNGVNRLQINPGTAVTDQGVLIIESEIKYLSIPTSANPVSYTVYYYHVDQQVTGGVAAVLTLDSGILTPAVVQGVILGYIIYPGGGVNLDATMFIQPPALQIGSSAPTENSANWIIPIKNQGYLITAQTGGSITFTDVFDTSATIPQVYSRIINNTTTVGTITIVYPFKVYDIPYYKLQINMGVDVNATVNPSFIDSGGTSTVLTLTPITGTTNLTFQEYTLPAGSVQTPNSLVYIMFEIQESPGRQVILQSLGLSQYNIPS
jgi:hypothetical protein